MAITGASRGQNSNNTAGTSFTFQPASNFAANSWAVLVMAYDNAGSAGADPFSSITDSLGNTWTSRIRALYDPGAASAGATLAIVSTDMSVGTLTTAAFITASFTNNTTAKAWALHEIIPTDSTKRINFVTSNNATGSSTATPTVTTVSSITNGNMIIGGGAAESTNLWVGDADTTNGTWSTHQSASVGTGTSGMAVTTQRKVVTATATQTYNPTKTATDGILAWAEFTEIDAFTPVDPVGMFGFFGI